MEAISRSKRQLLFFALLLGGCGPCVTDEELPITNGYVYGDTSKDEKYIAFNGSKTISTNVISSKVVSYWLEGDFLFAARKPRESYMEDGALNARLSRVCEYWVINVESHEMWGPAESVSKLPVADQSIDLNMINAKLNCI